MTLKRISLLMIILAAGVTCFARLYTWPIRAKPAITLAQAEAIGDKTIGEKHKGFFCIGARFTMLGDTDQEWELSYTSPKGESKWVIIDAKGGTQLLNSLRDL